MTIATVIGFVRELVNDEDIEVFTNAQITVALNALRWEGRYLKIPALKSVASGGIVTYKTFEAPEPWRYWSEDTVVYDSNYDPLTPATEDLTNARWTFSTEPGRPVYVLGWSHDPYGAAAELLTQRAGQLSEELQTFNSVNGSFSYANKRRGPLEMAAKYRSMSRSSVQVGTMYRLDTNVY